MIYVVIGAHCGGKSTFIKNSFSLIGAEEHKDLVAYTETESTILFGKYLNINDRIVGCDKLPRNCMKQIKEQVLRLKNKNKDFVIDGDKITYRPVINDLLCLGLPITLCLVTCSINVSIVRNREFGFYNEAFHKRICTKAMNIYNEYKDKVERAIYICTDDFTPNDFCTFGLNTIGLYETKIDRHSNIQLSLDFY